MKSLQAWILIIEEDGGPQAEALQDLGLPLSLCLASRPVCCPDELLDPGFTGKELWQNEFKPESFLENVSLFLFFETPQGA